MVAIKGSNPTFKQYKRHKPTISIMRILPSRHFISLKAFKSPWKAKKAAMIPRIKIIPNGPFAAIAKNMARCIPI
ncbi:MAG: hypothetical protein F9K48_03490 [Candidatus Brocadia sp.]|nr:MAG: hypothetical protein F9K48_03490 [Candidatus Brocadia sp.]